ncbi:type II toxin-antitoxin system CcdA family antitoxin [Desulfurispira natronophila]|uniref:Antitoxin CcdA n=1 Tax=Desulfurispira natronophila TaxID=682562 RepID=A0A7W7Y524_9BACT|nr:type II toxin-antitoxin system CcdA family antitoxin [Desulfurispira natronophila]MBB5022251.1 antitoxin CcdA [Desulfurispira natronophila]
MARCATKRQATNLTIDSQLLAEARAFNVSLSRAAEDGIKRAIQEHRAAAWLQANHSALQSSNDYVEKHGLPMDQYRNF